MIRQMRLLWRKHLPWPIEVNLLIKNPRIGVAHVSKVEYVGLMWSLILLKHLHVCGIWQAM
jgi:hypothetical protein